MWSFMCIGPEGMTYDLDVATSYMSDVTESRSTASPVACALYCAQYGVCVAINWYSITGACQLLLQTVYAIPAQENVQSYLIRTP